MKFSVKVQAGKLKRRCARLSNQVLRRQEDAALKRWAKIAAEVAYKYTPGGTPASAGRIKRRVAEDLDPAEVDIRWFTLPGASPRDRKAVLWADQNRQPGPFVAVKRTAQNRAALDAIRENPNGYGVRFVTSVGKHLKQAGNYNLRRKGRVWRLSWHGPRHISTAPRVNAEIRRRQKKVGGQAAGWNPLARFAGVEVPSTCSHVKGRGAARVVRRRGDQARLMATNKQHYGHGGVKQRVARFMPLLNRKIKRDARGPWQKVLRMAFARG